jgi:membrane associated rhomboid family serine protease
MLQSSGGALMKIRITTVVMAATLICSFVYFEYVSPFQSNFIEEATKRGFFRSLAFELIAFCTNKETATVQICFSKDNLPEVATKLLGDKISPTKEEYILLTTRYAEMQRVKSERGNHATVDQIMLTFVPDQIRNEESRKSHQLTKYNVNFMSLTISQLKHNDWWHLTSNLVFLLIFGSLLQSYLSPLRFLFVYIGASYITDYLLASFLIVSTKEMIGASDGVAGVVGAYLILKLKLELMDRKKFHFSGFVGVAAAVILFVITDFYEFYLGEIVLPMGPHILGLFVGSVLALFVGADEQRKPELILEKTAA